MLNDKQKQGLWLGIIMAVAMGVYPPWQLGDGTPGTYAPLSQPPEAVPGQPPLKIDYGRLFLQWGMVALITAGMVVTRAGASSSPSSGKGQSPFMPGNRQAGSGAGAGTGPGTGTIPPTQQPRTIVLPAQEGTPVGQDAPQGNEITLQFQSSSSLGNILRESDDDPDYWDHLTTAQGSVQVPADARLQLEISKEHRVDLTCLRNLAPGTFSSIDASDSKIEDGDLGDIAALTKLRELDLSNTRISDQGLKNLVPLRTLRKLWLDGTNVTDEGLSVLSQLPSLIKVSVSGTSVTESRIISLKDEKKGKCEFVLNQEA